MYIDKIMEFFSNQIIITVISILKKFNIMNFQNEPSTKYMGYMVNLGGRTVQ